MEAHEVRTERLRHAVLRAGPRAGGPLLALHGLTASKEDLAGVADPLASRGWDVVVPDQRGHGASEWPADPSAYSLADLTADAWALVDHVGWRDVVVVGHSLGGVVGQLMALEAPARVRALVLVASIPGPLPGGPSCGPRGLAGRLRRAGAGVAGRLRWSAGGRDDARPAGGADGAVGHSPVMLPAVLASLFRAPDRTPALGSLDVPTLVVGGALDDDHLAGSRALAEAIPTARLVVLDGVGHEVPTEAPERLTAEVVAFLDALPTDAG